MSDPVSGAGPLSTAISTFLTASDRWFAQKHIIALNEEVHRRLAEPQQYAGGVFRRVICDTEVQELLTQQQELGDRRNHLIAAGVALVSLLVAVDRDLAIAVQSVADAAKDGNPTHIYQTRRNIKARLHVLRAELQGRIPEPEPSPGARPPTADLPQVIAPTSAPPGWTELGPAKQEILRRLKKASERLQGRGIAKLAGYKSGTVRHHLPALIKWGYIDRTSDGYAITPTGAALPPV